MQRVASERHNSRFVAEVIAGLAAGDDPRTAIARLNREIVDYQKAGKDVPGEYLRLSRQLASECIAQSQGR